MVVFANRPSLFYESFMKIGDLIRFKDPRWNSWIGVILRQIPGTDRRQVVRWLSARQSSEDIRRDGRIVLMTASYPAYQLEVISENR